MRRPAPVAAETTPRRVNGEEARLVSRLCPAGCSLQVCLAEPATKGLHRLPALSGVATTQGTIRLATGTALLQGAEGAAVATAVAIRGTPAVREDLGCPTPSRNCRELGIRC